jgi:hypothetical protein
MSIFVFAVLAGFFIHQLMTIVQPVEVPRNARFRRFRFGPRIVLRLPARTYVRVKAGVLAVLVTVFALALIIILAQAAHPPEGYAFQLGDIFTSPRLAAVFFGGMVGILIGNMLNRILRGDKYELKSRDRLEIGLVILLFFLGIGGEELIRSYAKRINKISVGATNEISFSEAPAKATRASAEQPSNAGQKAGAKASEYLSTSGSNGLPKLRVLGRDIVWDQEYVRLIHRYEAAANPRRAGPEANNATSPITRLVQTTISPIGACLEGIFAKSADAEFVDQRLRELSTELRKLAALRSIGKLQTYDETKAIFKDVADNLAPIAIETHRHSRLILSAIQNPELDVNKAFVRDCKPLAMLVCDPKGSWKPGNDPAEWDEAEWRKNNALPDDDIRARIGHAIATGDATVQAGEVDSLIGNTYATPYAAIAYASVMAQLEYYEAAALTLDEWITDHPASRTDIAAQWTVLRARFALGVFVEEWIRSRDGGLALRQYHVDNLKEIMTGLADFAAIAGLERMNNQYDLKIDMLGASQAGDDGNCSMPERMTTVLDSLDADRAGAAKAASSGKPDSRTREATDILLNLYESYISAQSTYVDNFLKHTLLKVRSATIVDGRMKRLIRLDLKCIKPDNRPEMRAEILERHARNEINLFENLALLGNKDKLAERIQNSQRVVSLAIQLLDRQQRTERAGKEQAPGFLKKVSSSPIIELYETLLTTKGRLQEIAGDAAL